LTWARNRSRKDPVELIDRIFTALAEQTVTVPGTDAAELVIPQLAANIKSLQQQRETIAGQVEGMLDEFPLAEVLISMPGIGIKTASNILLAVGDCSDFASASHLAAYAGIAPVTRRGGTSIKGEFPSRSGNKRLKKRHVPQRLDSQQLSRPVTPLLPAQTNRRKEAQRRRHESRTPPEQCHLRHVDQPRVLPRAASTDRRSRGGLN
jgi:transposase